MIKDFNNKVTLTGVSGKKYVFNLYTYSDFDDVKGAFTPKSALYLFIKLSADQTSYWRVYLGKTGDLSTRFDSHHKEDCIRKHGANCIGIHSDEKFKNEKVLEEAEKDLLAAYNFPCNDQNN